MSTIAHSYFIRLLTTSLFIAGKALADPTPVFFFGSATTDGGKLNVAHEGWSNALGRPEMHMFDDKFDTDVTIPGATTPLSTLAASGMLGFVSTPLGTAYGVRNKGDGALFLNSRDSDNIAIKQAGTSYQGVGNVDDLLQPNVNLIGPGANKFIEVNFSSDLDVDKGTATFGTTESVGAYFSTTSAVKLEIFDIAGNSLGSTTQTPTNMSPFFLGVAMCGASMPPCPNQFPLIATARFSFMGSALDGLVFTTVRQSAAPQAPVPEPSSVWFSAGLTAAIGLAAWRARQRLCLTSTIRDKNRG